MFVIYIYKLSICLEFVSFRMQGLVVVFVFQVGCYFQEVVVFGSQDGGVIFYVVVKSKFSIWVWVWFKVWIFVQLVREKEKFVSFFF